MKILITGSAGFIGSHVSAYLLARGDEIIGIDNINDYYDTSLKESRLENLKKNSHFTEARINLEDRDTINQLFSTHKPQRVINLAAQAGVRYSLENPHAYIDSNIVGFCNILECCRHHEIEHLVYASSSSVYGANTQMPFSIHDNVDHPLSLYAASKKANELMAHTYSHLYQLSTTGLRFFTVYGPSSRPDMAAFKFTKNIFTGKPIDVYNHGKHSRDFTYIDDIVEGIVRVLDKPAASNTEWDSKRPDPSTSKAPFRIYNIGSHQPVELMRFIEVLEDCIGIKAKKNFLPAQPGDVPATYADVDDLMRDVGYQPSTPIETGLAEFIKWYRDYYRC